jgi:AraC family transcriptional regulator
MESPEIAAPTAALASVGAVPATRGFRHLGLAANANVVRRLALCADEPLCRVEAAGATTRFAEWAGVRAQLVTVPRGAPCECEFRLPSLVIMTHPQGGTAGYEWSDGGEMRRFARLPSHAVLLNPPGRYLRLRHRMRSTECLLLLTVHPSGLEHLVEDLPLAQVQFQQRLDLADAFLHRILQAFAEEIEAPGPGGRIYGQTLTLLLVTRLVRCASNLAPPQPLAYATGGLPGWRLKRALEMVEAKLTEGPSLSQLARHVGLHPTSFCRAFKQSTGVSPHRYLLLRQVARAKEMMGDQNLTLTQIALDCGFRTSSQFSVIFRRITGLAPSAYRRSL